ncbi:hypothetical protein PHMEG_00026625 [Phytophthora megakarya]|uniref:Uncharacterized protein n=1 Tax=Phytophthora megakarya TaxID=4795 RepID=A0A225VBQ3_9STRA|nr:hypothetical protein PHMEG_00026625 [Phytophthora megakarya]
MKGPHTPPNEWCVGFQLSLRDGSLVLSAITQDKTFISYYCSQFSQTASTRYYRAKLSDK